MAERKKWVSWVIGAVCIAGGLTLAAGACGVYLFSRYVHTEDADNEKAAREFESLRARFAGQQPLVEYRLNEPPVVHRAPDRPRQELHALHVVAYDAAEEELSRATIPASVLRLMTVGGRLRFMGVGMLGDDRDRITLEDLERHGPGLVLDFRGTNAWQMAVSDAVLGTQSQGLSSLCGLTDFWRLEARG